MKRHLAFLRDFDTRSYSLTDPKENWDPEVKKLHLENQFNLLKALKIELGEFNFEQKIENFKILSDAPFSIVTYHNSLYKQSRYCFIHGFYYAALTSACALGERILNHLILDLREDFKNTNIYKKVRGEKSIDNWGLCINCLNEWNIFQNNKVAGEFHKLKSLRMKSLHFNEDTYHNLREDALQALLCLKEIIALQFGFLGGEEWMVPNTSGQFFIKKDAEENSFIKKYYLPQCPLVTPYFSMDLVEGHWIIFDKVEEGEKEISDEEFAYLFNNRNNQDMVSTSIPWDKDIIARVVFNSEIHYLDYKTEEIE